ncbi:hypothetical protein CAEBREN_30322 [Caenorhabditis brenneri]|uniref:Uncharacterized protein n=1 Tax=Caenorhabditis brenneri TaxID=135651 RepID=G0MRY6_CAEBE|nr:hypothetical protein CAEBREN_30322 [Caenorhabditis brenneri]
MFPSYKLFIFSVKDDALKKERQTSAWSKPLNHSNFTHWHMRPENVLDEELKEYEDHRKSLIANQKKKK